MSIRTVTFPCCCLLRAVAVAAPLLYSNWNFTQRPKRRRTSAFSAPTATAGGGGVGSAVGLGGWSADHDEGGSSSGGSGGGVGCEHDRRQGGGGSGNGNGNGNGDRYGGHEHDDYGGYEVRVVPTKAAEMSAYIYLRLFVCGGFTSVLRFVAWSAVSYYRLTHSQSRCQSLLPPRAPHRSSQHRTAPLLA